MWPCGFSPDGPLCASMVAWASGPRSKLPVTESSVGTGWVWKVRVWAQTVGPPASSNPHNRKEYDVVSASPVTLWENRPLEPPGK